VGGRCQTAKNKRGKDESPRIQPRKTKGIMARIKAGLSKPNSLLESRAGARIELDLGLKVGVGWRDEHGIRLVLLGAFVPHFTSYSYH
jgi:hypothetical protein